MVTGEVVGFAGHVPSTPYRKSRGRSGERVDLLRYAGFSLTLGSMDGRGEEHLDRIVDDHLLTDEQLRLMREHPAANEILIALQSSEKGSYSLDHLYRKVRSRFDSIYTRQTFDYVVRRMVDAGFVQHNAKPKRNMKRPFAVPKPRLELKPTFYRREEEGRVLNELLTGYAMGRVILS